MIKSIVGCLWCLVQKALDAYSSCLEWIADNNLTIRRDVLEGMARCCTRLGQKDRALELAEILVIQLYMTLFCMEKLLSDYYPLYNRWF